MELERLDKYELVERLGRGGMGEVWKARDTQLRRYVAIKLLHADLQANPDFVTHFLREAQLVASLRHSNIVQVHDFQLIDTQRSSVKAYMVMDYIEGGTLADYIADTVRKGLFPSAADIVYLFTAISLALDYAHQQGMIHRDIKPANILLDNAASIRRDNAGFAPGEPILTDFGIARLQGASTSTVTRALIGTPRYMSPEQIEGHTVDERSDLYSLGIVLYEILTGITPFRGENAIALMMQHLHENPTPPNLINPKVTPALSSVVVQSIAKDPQARFQSASAMTAALAQAFGLPVPASLNKAANVNGQPGYNPLQPSASRPDSTAYPSTIATAWADSAGYPQAQPVASPVTAISPPHLTPERLTPVASDQGKREFPPPLSSSPRQPGSPRRRGLTIALVACVIVLLLGAGAFAVVPQLTSKNSGHSTPTPGTVSTVVGNIQFIHSSKASPNTYDQLQIALSNISAPPAGTVYYAWLEGDIEQDFLPHWPLQVSSGGSVHYTYLGDGQHTDLFAPNNLFLITAENPNSLSDIPSPDLSQHFYYATIDHSDPATTMFKVMVCPQGSSSNSTNPCS